MTATVAGSSSLQVLDDSPQPASQASSPTSPTYPSHTHSSSSRAANHLNGTAPSTNVPHFGASTFAHSVSLELPPGMSYAEFLRTWTDAHVARWLSDIKCGQHAVTFKANDIRGDVLLELDQVTLKEMGMASVGDRLRIVNGVKSLRQRCSSGTAAFASIMNRPRIADHGRTPSMNGDIGGYHTRTGSRRLESGRPAPLHLTPAGGSPDLPRIIRDGQDSARHNNIRPLPQPSSGSTHSTPTTAHSRTNLPPLPPPPRGQPPLPPVAPNARTLHPPLNALSGRRTPIQPESNLFPPQQPHASNLLTPTSQSQGRTPGRSQSPLPFPTSQPASRNLTRSNNDNGSHSRNGSHSNSAPPQPPSKPVPRLPTGNPPHPYASHTSPQHGLSPIAESFVTQRSNAGTPSPPTGLSHRLAAGLLRPDTPPRNNPSLDDLRRKLVRFALPDEGKSTTINVADCVGGVEVLVKALKKFGKLGSRGDSEGMEHVESEDGGLSVDGWGAYLHYGHEDSPGNPLTEAQLLAICHAPPDEPSREHGLTLRMIGKTKRSVREATPSPSSPVFATPSHDQDEDSLSPERLPNTLQTPATTKSMKRASSVSILSGLGVPMPENALEGAAVTSPAESPKESIPSATRRPSKLRNFFGQRPPSELITTHLAEYFPFTEKKVLERTRRQSMMRAAGGLDRRDSTISWNPSSQSRFSVSTLDSQRNASPRVSVSSASTVLFPEKPSPLPPLPTDTSKPEQPPRLSLSTDNGNAIELSTKEEDQAYKRLSSPHILPPVAFPSESLSESLNLNSSQLGARPLSRTMSTASKRMSFITELRSKRDRSDTASLMTVDEITAEVESRRESADVKLDPESTEEWTKVDVGDDIEKESIKEVAEGESESEDSEEEDDDNAADDDAVTDEDEPGKAITSAGSERTIKWIKGALIGAGSFGKVYLGMDTAHGLLMAVKQVELPTGSAPNEERKKSMLSALEREIELLRDLHHENIVQYLSSCIDDDHLNIFLEYVPGGSVTSLLRNYGAFEEPLVRNWVRQILQGLNYLHERDIIHRDIKGANMLVDNKGGIKISDFGISKKVEDNLLPGHRAHRPSLQGSVFWMAPEVVKQTAYTQKADIWSIGCLVVEMLTGEHPWAQLTQMQAIFKV
ncbi:hypothetical protein AcV7_009014 [Taiwanofungus camphoratus]|nr:hypothetical protein AcV7_009014 [Antrodia cinnamomea]